MCPLPVESGGKRLRHEAEVPQGITNSSQGASARCQIKPPAGGLFSLSKNLLDSPRVSTALLPSHTSPKAQRTRNANCLWKNLLKLATEIINTVCKTYRQRMAVARACPCWCAHQCPAEIPGPSLPHPPTVKPPQFQLLWVMLGRTRTVPSSPKFWADSTQTLGSLGLCSTAAPVLPHAAASGHGWQTLLAARRRPRWHLTAPHEHPAAFPQNTRQIWKPVSTNHSDLPTHHCSVPEQEGAARLC